jgi:hypothetical protein
MECIFIYIYLHVRTYKNLIVHYWMKFIKSNDKLDIIRSKGVKNFSIKVRSFERMKSGNMVKVELGSIVK